MKRSLLSVGVLIVIGLLALAPHTWARKQTVFDQLDLLVDIRSEIVGGYVEQPDENKMVEQAVRSMVDSLGDPYTVYLSPEELEPFDKQIRGSFSGIGAEVDIDEKTKRLRIVTPLEESPAWKAGVMAGDVVLEIDGVSTEGISITEAVGKLTGAEGTTVTIRVRHEAGEEAVFVITRARINVQTVKGLRRDKDNHWDFMLNADSGIGYVRVSQFTDKTADDIQAALDNLVARNARGVILDLRFNPGGLLESAVEVSDMFLDEGKRIVSVKGRVVAEQVQWSKKEGTIPEIPIVVLANEASASAAEIVTGALADNDRAVFIGTRTFGKGSVQQVRLLENGRGAIKITNAYYYLPSGRNIHRKEDAEVWGVDPRDGYYVSMSPEQVREMLKIRRDGDILRPVNGGVAETITADFAQNTLKDPQLAAAIRALDGKLTAGEWPQVGESNAVALANAAKKQNLERQRDLLLDRLDQIDTEIEKMNGHDAATTQPAGQTAEEPAADAAETPAETVEPAQVEPTK